MKILVFLLAFVVLTGFSYAGKLPGQPDHMPCIVCLGLHAGGPNGEVIEEYCAYGVNVDENACAECSKRVWCRVIDFEDMWYEKDELCDNNCD